MSRPGSSGTRSGSDRQARVRVVASDGIEALEREPEPIHQRVATCARGICALQFQAVSLRHRYPFGRIVHRRTICAAMGTDSPGVLVLGAPPDGLDVPSTFPLQAASSSAAPLRNEGTPRRASSAQGGDFEQCSEMRRFARTRWRFANRPKVINPSQARRSRVHPRADGCIALATDSARVPRKRRRHVVRSLSLGLSYLEIRFSLGRGGPRGRGRRPVAEHSQARWSFFLGRRTFLSFLGPWTWELLA